MIDDNDYKRDLDLDGDWEPTKKPEPAKRAYDDSSDSAVQKAVQNALMGEPLQRDRPRINEVVGYWNPGDEGEYVRNSGYVPVVNRGDAEPPRPRNFIPANELQRIVVTRQRERDAEEDAAAGLPCRVVNPNIDNKRCVLKPGHGGAHQCTSDKGMLFYWSIG